MEGHCTDVEAEGASLGDTKTYTDSSLVAGKVGRLVKETIADGKCGLDSLT